MNAVTSFLVEQSSLRLLLVDDHPLFLDGLELVLENAFESVNITAASTIDEAIHALQSGQDFDLITLDWSLPDAKGGSLLRFIQNARLFIPVLVVSATENPMDLRLAMNSGASGFVSKSLGRKALLEAIEQVLQGRLYVNGGKLEAKAASVEAGMPNLTVRQQDVLELLARGWSNKQICASLNLTEHTVKTHLKALFHALDVRNRTECVRRAQMLGLVES